MSLNYKTPAQIAQQYYTHLKSLKPTVNTDQTDSDWWIRGQVIGGVFSGIYADQKRISDDAFPQLARRDALLNHLIMWFGSGFKDATQSQGYVNITASATGASVTAGAQIIYDANGNTYSVDQNVSLGTAVTGQVHVVSVNAGGDQNLLAGANVRFLSPPTNINAAAVVADGNISDGTDVESNSQGSSRVLDRLRTPLAGGKVSDYREFALAADPAVADADILRYPFGFGTVGVVIRSGSVDIDTAVDNGIDPVVIPSQALIDIVQAYIETQEVVTDCVTVLPPTELPVDVTVKVKFSTGHLTDIPTGQTLTQEQLVQREVKRALYKTPLGGRKVGASGYVFASDIDETLGLNLANDQYEQGVYAQILVDRNVEDLSATGSNLLISALQVPIPGTITVVEV